MAGGPLIAGDQVMLIDSKDRRYLVRLEAGGEFHTHAGILPHDGIIGSDEGALLRANSASSVWIRRSDSSRAARARVASPVRSSSWATTCRASVRRASSGGPFQRKKARRSASSCASRAIVLVSVAGSDD